MKKDKRVVVGYLAIGSLMTMGVYHFIKKRKNKTNCLEQFVDDYNENHNNSKITFENIGENDEFVSDNISDIKSIDPEKRSYSILKKIKN